MGAKARRTSERHQRRAASGKLAMQLAVQLADLRGAERARHRAAALEPKLQLCATALSLHTILAEELSEIHG